MRTIYRGATLITCDADLGVVSGDLVVEDGVITAVGDPTSDERATVMDVTGRWLLPGFVQTHVHLVQTLFRGQADDLPLLPWLQTRIWPLERAHDSDSAYWSARLGITELLLGGTTAILDMATVHHTDSVFRAAEEAGIRALIGKAMMDRDNEAGLGEDTETSIQSACDLADRWHEKGRLGYAFAPRFVPSCSEALLTRTAEEARRRGAMLHTHASENRDEVALVRELTGRDNVAYLADIGFVGPDVVLAHCIHLTQAEAAILADTKTAIAHCPGSNLKLGSGIAPIPELLRAGARCTLGADGAPCNNRLDMFAEMRLAALIQKPRLDPTALDADTMLDMATRAGGEALGLDVGRLAPGLQADFVVLDPNDAAALGDGPEAGAIVYAMTPRAVREVYIAGEQVVVDGRVVAWDPAETVRGVRGASRRVRERAFS